MLTKIIIILAILFLVALLVGAFALFWNKDKTTDKK